MRKLASIQRIKYIAPIEGADAIVVARVLGWNVVVKKGEFEPGDLCVYVEIDSLLPERPEFEFMRPRGFRIKTAKLRGQVSQGICFPLDILPSWLFGPIDYLIEEDRDVTEALGITKYEPPIPANLSGKVKGSFPGHTPKTDETRVQVLEPMLVRHRGVPFFATEKLDGSSFTAFLRDGEFGVCSRNLHLDYDPGHTFWQIVDELELEDRLRAVVDGLGHDLAIQGEVIGPRIQGNKYKLKKPELRVFNLFNVSESKYLGLLDFATITIDALGLETVPIVIPHLELNHTVDELLELAKGNSVLNPSVRREGLVWRPLVEMDDPDLGRLSFKTINNDFLIKYGDD